MRLFSFFSKGEPDFESIKFKKFEDSLQNFLVFYPEHWKFEDTTAIIDGEYTINFHSGKSDTHLIIDVKTRIPAGFNEKKFVKSARDEIEKPSAGIVSKACKKKFGKYCSVATEYTYSKGNTEFRGEKTIFYTGDRVFSLFFICPVKEYDKLKKTFEYVKDSFTIKPKKMMLL